MDKEEEISKEMEVYRKLAEQDKNIDVSGLMLQALEKKTNQNLLPTRQVRVAYIVSIFLPPFGLLYAVKFYFSNTDNGKEAALICAVLTAVSLFVTLLLFNMVLSQSGASLDQLQQINPQDVRDLLE